MSIYLSMSIPLDSENPVSQSDDFESVLEINDLDSSLTVSHLKFDNLYTCAYLLLFLCELSLFALINDDNLCHFKSHFGVKFFSTTFSSGFYISGILFLVYL